MTRRGALALALLCPLLAACGDGAPARPAEERRVPVEVVTAVAAPFVETYEVAAPAEPQEVIRLGAEVGGTLREVRADVGQRVHVGDVLARIDPEPLTLLRDRRRAEVERAAVARTIADRTLARQRALHEERTVTDAMLDDAELSARLAAADLRLAELALKDAERDLANTTVRAPAAGEITRRYPDPGSVLAKGAPLFHLARTGRIRLVPGLSEAQVVHVRPGAAAEVRFDALPDRVFAGAVLRVGAPDEAGQASFPVEVRVDNPDGAIRPGMVARVRLEGRTLPETFAVPAVALRHGERGVGLFVVQDARAARVPVEVAALVDETAVIAGGLAAGMGVVVVGQTALKGGEKVLVTVRVGVQDRHPRDDPAVYGLP